MRITFLFLFAVCSSICLAQTDSMFVEKMDGSIRGYPISLISQISFSGIPTSVHEQELVQNVLTSFTLYQNYPNPFNPSTTIQYNVPKAGDVEVNIFDIQGRLVRSLAKTFYQAVIISLVWILEVTQVHCASGTYFCQFFSTVRHLLRNLYNQMIM